VVCDSTLVEPPTLVLVSDDDNDEPVSIDELEEVADNVVCEPVAVEMPASVLLPDIDAEVEFVGALVPEALPDDPVSEVDMETLKVPDPVLLAEAELEPVALEVPEALPDDPEAVALEMSEIVLLVEAEVELVPFETPEVVAEIPVSVEELDSVALPELDVEADALPQFAPYPDGIHTVAVLLCVFTDVLVELLLLVRVLRLELEDETETLP
jgi:hypothetical protein